MVVIRLARGGAKKRPFYRMVVADSQYARDGRFIERVGHYNPLLPDADDSLVIRRDRIDYWCAQGAQCSPTVKRLVKQYDRKRKNTVPESAITPAPQDTTAPQNDDTAPQNDDTAPQNDDTAPQNDDTAPQDTVVVEGTALQEDIPVQEKTTTVE